MNKLILFLSLIAVASSHVPRTTRLPVEDECANAGPEVYCATARYTSYCNAKEFCKKYLSESSCEKGPEVYCKSTKTAQSCNQEAFCATWLDASVLAVKLPITTKSPARSSISMQRLKEKIKAAG